MDVIDHLIEEHRKAEGLLTDLADSEPGASRRSTLDELESTLSTHMDVEERFLYPIVAEVVGTDEEQGAENEHDLTRDGLSRMRALVDQPGFGAAVDMVTAGIGHHVHEEEGQIFPQLRNDAADRIAALGDPEELEQRVGSRDESTTKEELYERAKAAHIAGRSAMTKDQLADALREA